MLPSGDGHDDDDVKEDTVVWLADDEITFRPPKLLSSDNGSG